MKNQSFIKCLAALSLLLALSFQPARATTVLPLSLEQMSQKAHLIIYATVREVNTGIEPGVDKNRLGPVVTWTSFDVIEVIKGEAGESHTIKQIGGRLENGRSLRVLGVPRYEVGRSYVVFLTEPSSIGYSSPIGLHQGSFTVQEVDGIKTVSNGRKLEHNHAGRAAVAPLATSVTDPSSAQLADFLSTVRAYTKE